MAVTITLSRTETARVRFAYSPLAETVFAVKLLFRGGANAVHHRWARQAATAVAGDPDLPLLADLTSECVPAFLLPPPPGPEPVFADELDRVRRTPHDRFRAELDRVVGPDGRPELRADPEAALERLAGALRRHHDRLIAPHWGRMRAILLADVEHRARTLAARGVEGLFAALHENITWREGDLVVSGRRTPGSFTVDLGGHGLVLFPTIFCWPYICIDMEPWAAGSLRYPARGLGTLWEPAGPVPEGLAAVLGRTKAALLEALGEPRPTGELARRLGITASAVSQHVGALREAGLVTTRRDGRTALHLRTERGTRLTQA
ncbi:DUF5937 family protein [Planomonospora sp. ID82291]|uniref:ArsR/SmtB family transcription factor n=1 Tax=Planomonospora sp. ID82291 TaxID=2738136 RepID=UPI0018C3BA72|nr:DUF5937 family protein [Planomonospora sp. ID82291]MBG0813229.1 winged helix-turn-helix transcriptional regulator [Planomonospora sp. ID82291]